MSRKWLPRWLQRHIRKRNSRDALRERDGDDCWRCGHPMRFDAPFNVGKFATIEHVVPVWKGGTWDLHNLRLCHVGCNRHLGANTPEQKERMRLKR